MNPYHVIISFFAGIGFAITCFAIASRHNRRLDEANERATDSARRKHRQAGLRDAFNLAAHEWASVDGFDDYLITIFGDVISLKRNRLIMLRKNRMTNGYDQVQLRQDGKSSSLLVHRIVAAAFLPNPDGLPVVHHIDACRHNNHVDNLEWTCYSGNMRHHHELRRKEL